MAMPIPFRATFVLASLALGIAEPAGRAQTNPANAPVEESVFKDATKSAAAADAAPASTKLARPKRERVMSEDLAATLAVGMPKYSPPKPPEKKVDAPATDNADARDANKPKNGIIRLPDYVVRETRSPVFKDRDLATPDRKADIGMKRYAGLNFGPFASLNRPIALAMVQEQERLDNMSELADDAKTSTRAGDTATANYIMRESQKTYLRGDNQAPTYGIGK